MKLIILSDSHGRGDRVRAIVHRHIEEADAFVFLGDILRDVEEARAAASHASWYLVPGNCDRGSELPGTLLVELPLGDWACRTLITHGHDYAVKRGLSQLEAEAGRRSADLVFFGHTHQVYRHYRGGIHYLNPGSLSRPKKGNPSYGIVDITSAGIFPHIVEIG